ncbi:MAG: hypothetical protein IPN17_07215 [Deltaproteobacteria bacterium]|nr:hypothetical protein [Deltaproteobacteria bacterium]
MDVRIELIDEADGKVIADSEVPLESLPERFAGNEAKLTIGDAEYLVVRAEPATRDTIASLGSGRLTLRRLDAAQPKAILFSLPSIENALPPTVPIAPGVEVTVRLPDDAWRQVELVHVSAMEAIDAELTEVRRVIAESRLGPGFVECHLRHRLPDPLAGARVTLTALAAALGVEARPFGFRGDAGMVEGGFSLPYSDAVVYGLERDGVVTTLAVHGFLEDIVGGLHPVALEQGLVLVDWRKAEKLRAVEEGFAL